MDLITQLINEGKKNFVFIGEAGCGKSEISINFAVKIAALNIGSVHFFDMDQTKPLFRSRDVKETLEGHKVCFHYEEQYFDVPTLVGGVKHQFSDDTSFTVMDVGGNRTGAKLIGGFSEILNQDNTIVLFVLNPYRPWAKDTVSVDETLFSILSATHIKKVRIVSNPNVGPSTTKEEFLEGSKKVEEMIGKYMPVDFTCIEESLHEGLCLEPDISRLPIKLYLTYPWMC